MVAEFVRKFAQAAGTRRHFQRFNSPSQPAPLNEFRVKMRFLTWAVVKHGKRVGNSWTLRVLVSWKAAGQRGHFWREVLGKILNSVNMEVRGGWDESHFKRKRFVLAFKLSHYLKRQTLCISVFSAIFMHTDIGSVGFRF